MSSIEKLVGLNSDTMFELKNWSKNTKDFFLGVVLLRGCTLEVGHTLCILLGGCTPKGVIHLGCCINERLRGVSLLGRPQNLELDT